MNMNTKTKHFVAAGHIGYAGNKYIQKEIGKTQPYEEPEPVVVNCPYIKHCNVKAFRKDRCINYEGCRAFKYWQRNGNKLEAKVEE